MADIISISKAAASGANRAFLKMGSMNSMKRIGEMGEPCGRPAGTWKVWLVWFPRRILAVRLWVKLATHRITLIGHPCARSRLISRPDRTASKAPCMSSVSMEAFRPLAHVSSTSWIKAAARSVAERSGRAPNCWGCRTLYLIAIHAILRAIRRSRPFPRTDRRAISL